MVRKGVSPVVAVVLLIAVAIAVGIIVSNWVTHLVSVEIIGEASACTINTNYIIESANYNRSGDDTLLIKVTNKNKQNLYKFGVMLDNSTHIVLLNSTSWRVDQGGISEISPLGREQSAYITINMTVNYTYFGSTLTEVRLLNDACDAVAAETNAISQS